MDFTFGIVTSEQTCSYINTIIDSINKLNISNYEILIFGISGVDSDNILYINTNSNLSTKKNMISEKSKYENIVFIHDYIIFDDNWYSGYLEYGDNFDICMNVILNKDLSRYRDWCLWLYDANKYVSNNNYLIPYDMNNISNMLYISGAFWVAKKSFMLKNKLNEKLGWGQGEDVEWSLRVRELIEFKFNINSKVKLLKQKDRIFNLTTEEENMKLREIKNYDSSNSYNDLIKNHLSQWI